MGFRSAATLLLAVGCAPTAHGDALAKGSPADLLAITPFVTGLEQVTDFRFLPDGRLIIIEKDGALRVRTAKGELTQAAQLPVDIESEKGGLGVEVHPDFAKTKTIFVYYSRSDEAGGTDLNR